jgi:hypothetical protein
VEAALAPLHVKGGSPCEYPHTTRDHEFRENQPLYYHALLITAIG